MKPLTVLVVDDSAVMRQVAAAVLSRDRALTVVPAADPLIAMEKMSRARPDVILLDLAMPRMDGLTFLRRIMREDPLPVVICSVAGSGSPRAIEALEAGALAIVSKPELGVRAFVEDSADTLIEALRGAAEAGPRLRRRVAAPARVVRAKERATTTPARRVVAIGASTGGTQAIEAILTNLSAQCPAVVIAQHMPAGFTDAFARRLDSICALEVKEAADGDEVRDGRALVAPGGLHLRVVREQGRYVARVEHGAPVSRHRPSVDVLFRSVADAAGAGAVGVLLTGMGEDGAEGLRAMHAGGALTLAQDEATCVVFGMPKAAVARGAVDQVLPLSAIASWLEPAAM